MAGKKLPGEVQNTAVEKLEQKALENIYDKPLVIWVPSIGIGNLSFYNGKSFS